MPIPDWVARETRYLHLGCFHVLSAMFTDGQRETLEDGRTQMVLRSEFPEEVAMLDRFLAVRVWKQLERAGLVQRRRADHRSMAGRRRDSFVCQDRIVQFSSVPNGSVGNCSLPASEAREIARYRFEQTDHNEVFESESEALTRARAIIISADAGAAIHQQHHHHQPASPALPPSAAAATDTQPTPTVLEALEICQVEDAEVHLITFGHNSCAIALRLLVSAMARAAIGKQQPVESRAKFIMYNLSMMRGKRFEELTDLSFLAWFVRPSAPADPKVTELFPARGEA